MHSSTRLRALLGVFAQDLPRYMRALWLPGGNYLAICNRDERLEPTPDGKGYGCKWQWTSDLHAPKYLPALGRRLMQRALADHPIRRAANPAKLSQDPEISFVIGHRGVSRLPHLLATLESIAGQQGARIECLVVEQDQEPHAARFLPAWVRHIHTPPPVSDMPYCRSWAFNVGIRNAAGAALVLHDNDMLVPQDYGASLLAHFREGFEVINLKRFTFYLTEGHTAKVLSGESTISDAPPLAIMQNSEAGGSVAITRDAYAHIGGMDESFVGWGGEDNEFWERAQTRRLWPYAYLPMVHLWHPAQPGKQQAENPTMQRYRALSAIAPAERIARLRQSLRGELSGPVGWAGGCA